ncbi:uncharacterized protein [Lolium perenne]|uniref:uncharacterized protein n=1 Tax=Lolium perenne TaxID=4522 RepID=UPI003A99EAA5
MAPCCSPVSTRDCAELGDGPAGLIADRVLACDVADYVRFRAVCRSWRRCSADPRAHGGLGRRFHPRRWVMLREELAVPDRRSFLNTSTGDCVQVNIPELRDHLLLAVTPEGLLVLVHKPQRATVRLLNPLTRHLTELPPLTTLLPPKDHDKLSEDNVYFDGQFKAWGSGIANDDSTVVLCFSKLRMIGMAKPGDDSWNLLDYSANGMTTAPLMFAGRFYCVNHSGVMVLDLGADQPPQLKVAAELSMLVSPISDSMHLVDNCGELMLVHRRCGQLLNTGFKSGRLCDAYRVDLDSGTLFLVDSLGGSAVFAGFHCSFSVPLEVFPSGTMSAYAVYFSFDIAETSQSKAEGNL